MVEAHSTREEVMQAQLREEDDTGILIPWIDYETGSIPVEVEEPGSFTG